MGETVLWKDIKIIKVTKEYPDRLFYNISYEQEYFHEIIGLKKLETLTKNHQPSNWNLHLLKSLELHKLKNKI